MNHDCVIAIDCEHSHVLLTLRAACNVREMVEGQEQEASALQLSASCHDYDQTTATRKDEQISRSSSSEYLTDGEHPVA
jgi:hypothetical protein